MRNNESLYFDIWRKKDFKALLMAYTQTAHLYKTQEEMRTGFAEMLDMYVEGGKKKYIGTKKQWLSAYTLGRELGVFRRKVGEHYELSKLAKDFLDSKILASEYMLNYLLNFNQLISGKVVHPLYEVLMVIRENGGTITKNNINNISEFNLSAKTPANQRQIVNIFLHRLVDAKILEPTGQRDLYRLTNKIDLEELIKHCNIYNKSADEFENIEHEDFVDMLSYPSPLIQVYR
ncbi:hypothetical protein [Niallia sp. RD1]|uniref:hypothetical protein n=1 Tax=Niallia sp. RD1 TaxID=2962858 RepID=UPI0020C1A805|nr:hypothetical protein [Niallia sp. RD1]UTI43285.1 hypothetical protein NKG37_06080 [Niallia sp. RD1]